MQGPDAGGFEEQVCTWATVCHTPDVCGLSGLLQPESAIHGRVEVCTDQAFLVTPHWKQFLGTNSVQCRVRLHICNKRLSASLCVWPCRASISGNETSLLVSLADSCEYWKLVIMRGCTRSYESACRLQGQLCELGNWEYIWQVWITIEKYMIEETFQYLYTYTIFES